MRFYKLISLLFHPILLPIASLLAFYIIDDTAFSQDFKIKTILIVFSATYILPVCILVLLMKYKLVNSLELNSINERKFPIIIMTLVFLILGVIFKEIFNLYTPSNLFLGVSLALLVNLLFFIKNIKVSIHMIGLASMLIFIVKLSILYLVNLLPLVIALLLISGLVASARLHLKAHTSREVYIGFALGISTQLINVVLYKI